MILTVKATGTFPEPVYSSQQFIEERNLFLDKMVQDQKTDGILTVIIPNLTMSREFIDQNAAVEYVNFTNILLAEYGMPTPTVTYETIS